MKTNEVKSTIETLYSNKIDPSNSIVVIKGAVGSGKTEHLYKLINTCSFHRKVALISKEKFDVPKCAYLNVTNFSDNILQALQNLETVLELGNIEIGLLAIDDMYENNKLIYSELQKFSIKHDCYVVVNTSLGNTFAESDRSKLIKLLNDSITKNFTQKVPEYSVNLISGKYHSGKTSTLNSSIVVCNTYGGKALLITLDVSQFKESDNLIIKQHNCERTLSPLSFLNYAQDTINRGFDLSLLAIDDFIDVTQEQVSELRKFAYKNKCNVIVTSTKHSDYFDSFIAL